MQRTMPKTSGNSGLAQRYRHIRAQSESLCAPLAAEDYVVQSMADVSPTKWHIAHTTWFFETFVVGPNVADYRPFHPQFAYLFNSYYNAVGPQFLRPERGLLTRPTVTEVMAYRRHVDAALLRLLDSNLEKEVCDVIELGLNHEQQHQELLLMDIKHVFFCNPLYPAYREARPYAVAQPAADLSWTHFESEEFQLGANTHGDFTFDNETPRHSVNLPAFSIADRPITNAEYRAFIADGGYRQPLLWLADGWVHVQTDGWQAPLYWVEREGEWLEFTLDGLVPINPAAPVCHVSFYEADAYATWANAKLPSEAQWERAARDQKKNGGFLDDGALHPRAPKPGVGLQQMYGDVWEWTSSAYQPYPGYTAATGALGEYNGKFMCNQMVLRGGCCASYADHIRATYRNFFYPRMRWQFAGIRLAR